MDGRSENWLDWRGIPDDITELLMDQDSDDDDEDDDPSRDESEYSSSSDEEDWMTSVLCKYAFISLF